MRTRPPKKISKTDAVTSQLDYKLDPDNVHVGPSDYVPWLTDRKYCYIVMEGTTFGEVPLKAELKPELRRRRDRRGALLQTGPRPRCWRSDRRAVILLHEVASRAVHR